jgi:DNA replication protein DnaC
VVPERCTLEKFDKYDLIVLDDISYVRKDQAETSVLFELIPQRPSIDWSITPPSSR